MSDHSLKAGASSVNITPEGSVFLFGYPHVPRNSTGVHDPLLCSALFLDDGRRRVVIMSCDVIWVPKEIVASARKRIAAATGIPESHILVAATHTHSGPVTADMLSNEIDPVVPKADRAYVAKLESALIEAAQKALAAAAPAEIAMVIADGSAVGTNRRDPAGPRDPQTPVMLVRQTSGKPVAALLVCSMHPTILHEDSTLISGDFPAATRQYLQRQVLKADVPVVYMMGPSGNQSPRHVTRENTFAEMQRIGDLLGKSIENSAKAAVYRRDLDLAVAQAHVRLPQRQMPGIEDAQRKLSAAVERLETLRREKADPRQVRTAECDWFGAEETLALARAAASGRLAKFAEQVMPAEIQAIRTGPWRFVGWQGEVFVEYALNLKRQCPDAFVISLANGDLQGYLVTPEAAAEGGYEASNAIFEPCGGDMMVNESVRLLEQAEMRSPRRPA